MQIQPSCGPLKNNYVHVNFAQCNLNINCTCKLCICVGSCTCTCCFLFLNVSVIHVTVANDLVFVRAISLIICLLEYSID